MRRISGHISAIGAALVITAVSGFAQTPLGLTLEKAESLRMEYRFDEAAELCENALEEVSMATNAADSSGLIRLEQTMTLSRNGGNMLRYASFPKAVAKKRLSLEEFFLWYPLDVGTWCQTPNVFDKVHGFPFAAFVPENASEIYFSSHDGEGLLNIYRSEHADTVWTAPELAGESLTSGGNDAFPFLSSDGKSLYFSSDALYGAGGYDLYVSRWNAKEKAWEDPENLGFPYSSPYNDYFFASTADGSYSLFASDRECPGSDSVYVYVIEFDSTPVRRAITDPSEALSASRLTPSSSSTAQNQKGGNDVETGRTRRYVMQLRQVQAIKNKIASMQDSMDKARSRMSELDSSSQKELSEDILSSEMAILDMRDSLAKASKALQESEMDLLSEGIVIDPETVLAVSDEANGSDPSFEFVCRSFGSVPDMVFAAPKSSFDYSFMVLPVGRFAEDNTLPDGLVYQIQIFSRTTGEAKESDLKGLSPVFYRKDKSGKTIYSAGIFRSYNDCLSALSKVKRAGFKSAMVVAFRDGESVSVSTARQLEKTLKSNYGIRIRPESGRLSESDLSAINSTTTKDLVRETIDGQTTYFLGTWSDYSEASTVLSALKAAGLSDISVETVTE